MANEDSINLRLSAESHKLLTDMTEAGVFKIMADGYRLGIAYAIARDLPLRQGVRLTENFINVGSLDKGGLIQDLITELFPQEREAPYAYAARLADTGVLEIGKLHRSNQLRFTDLFDELSMNPGALASETREEDALGADETSV